MKVKVKDGCVGFFGGKIVREDDVFTIVPKEHSALKDEKGDPVVISEDEQFSSKWMIKLDEDKPKRGRKKQSPEYDSQ
jgi:hypothetical protein